MRRLVTVLGLWLALSAIGVLGIEPSLIFANEAPAAKVAVSSGNVESGDAGSADTPMPDLFTGAMSYQIPINVPQGRNGLSPELSLTYRSNNGNGWIGVGWELEFGSIRRATKNGVNYSGDNYQFKTSDSTSDIVNVGSSEYLSMVESQFSRIRKLTATDNRTYWEITDKKGMRFFFGQSTASRQDNPANINQIFKWCLDRVEDPNGNYITISYTKDQGEIYPNQINYNGNQVKFYYGVRNDASARYTAGFLMKTSKRLALIDIISADSSRVRSYKFTYIYSTATSRSILSSLQEFGKDVSINSDGSVSNENTASKLPSQFFNVISTGNSINESLWTSTSPNWGGAEYTWGGDFDGDGRADIATASSGTIWVKLSKVDQNGNIFFEERVWTTSAPNWGSSAFTWVRDFNGDGRADIATASSGTIWVKLSKVDQNGNNIFEEQVWTTSAPNWGSSAFTWVGDFNGDGRADIATASSGTIWVKLSKVDQNGNNFFEEQAWTTSAPNWGSSAFTWVGDFNGDGRADIATALNGNIWVKLSKADQNGNSFFEERVWTTSAPNWGAAEYTWAGDFNGDGRADIATALNGTIWVKLSKVDQNGNNIFEEQVWATSAPNWGAAEYTWAGDFNGDGLKDIATALNGTIWIKRSTGSNFLEEVWTTSTPSWGDATYCRIGDFNGDGKTEIATALNGKIWVKQPANFTVDTVVKITNVY